MFLELSKMEKNIFFWWWHKIFAFFPLWGGGGVKAITRTASAVKNVGLCYLILGQTRSINKKKYLEKRNNYFQIISFVQQ